MRVLECAGTNWGPCRGGITHLDEKGYVYCTGHGQYRREGSVKCRKLAAWELKRLQSGKPLRRYKPGPKPPPCALEMGCLCAGHARGNPTSAACDTSEQDRGRA